MSLTLINCDLSQAELRVMALLSNDPWMINALQEGVGDYFDTYMMPAAFPWIIEKYGSIKEFKKQEPAQHKELRTQCKAVQYGLAFGREAKAIAVELNCSVRQAANIIMNYLSTAVGFQNWRIDVMEAAVDPAKRDLLINPFGRKFQSEVITSRRKRDIQREALSFLPQSTSSDICLSTAIRINKPLQEMGYHIFNIVHDAIMIEGEADGADVIGQYVAKELRETGRMVFGDTVPFLAEYSIGESWADLD